MEITKITRDNFEKEVTGSAKPILVDFWGTWCGPCMMQGPVLDEIAAEYDSIRIGKVNVDEEQALAIRFGVSSIPTLILFKNGEIEKRLVGLRTKDQLAAELGL